MDNLQKRELRQIIKSIPKELCVRKISVLYQMYGLDFTYGTFRQYFKIFNQLNGTSKLNYGNESN